jgi:hypothetical protein
MLVRLSGRPNFPDSPSPHVYKAPLSMNTETSTYEYNNNNNNNNNNPLALVCERTILTERLPLVGEVNANVCG